MFLHTPLTFLTIFTPVLAIPTIRGFNLTWSDDFTGPFGTLPNKDDWIIDIGTSYPGGPPNWGNGEAQYYTDDPANLRLTGDGNLQITPLRSPNGTWTSARIETQRTNFKARKGGKMRIQARIQTPDVSGREALGYWAAFWTLGRDLRGNYQNWPSIGELDIMENLNGEDRHFGVMHCGINPGGPCNEPSGLGANQACPNSPCPGNWHVYAIEVDRTRRPETVRWFVDGEYYHNVTETVVGRETWEQAIHEGHFVLLNLAMGGTFPNALTNVSTPTNGTVPGRPMLVDYVAVYNS
ncbi:beta-glucanase [Elsinoe ampelina]|uniref:Beta-glucanase n=1 Tax=Elsinoe ampelina TaxID=302913 RepID=A0A6A6GJG8_9PEZI|nr:beta-glucanase [Elsinoe ampelina]